MTQRFLRMLFFALPMLFAMPAFAILELNIGYQGLLSNSASGNWVGTGTSFGYSGGYGLQADARFNFPLSDWQIGMRYGQLGLSGSQSGATLAMNATTYSGLVGYRFINTGILFGPVFTYALSGSGTLQNKIMSFLSTPRRNTSTASFSGKPVR